MLQHGHESSPGAVDATAPPFARLFARRAADNPGVTALHTVTVRNRQPTATAHTVGQVWQDTLTLADRLATSGIQPGDRILLSVQGADRFLAAFMATQWVGAIPVPVPSLAELPSRAYELRIASIAADARPSAIFVGDERSQLALSQHQPAAHVFDVGAELATPLPRRDRQRQLGPAHARHRIAFLQYTSGSTGAPKGVVVRHDNLLANLHAIIDGATMNRGDVIYSWLPLFHDMGLIAGLLLGVYLDIPTFIAPPKTFMTRPESWLRAIHCFGATFSAAPNFAYHAAAHKLPDRALTGLDLSTWRLAFAGAELVEPATIEKFVSRYQSYGFRPGSLRPAYGLAECTLAVAFPRQSSAPRFDCIDREAMTRDGVAVPGQAEEPRSVTYASVGRAVPKHTVSIRDVATGAELPERRLGEVVVTGPSVTPGYFSELRAGTPEQTELRTGDLGYLLEGELFIVDRIKDVLIVAGRKYSPSDIEREVSSLEGIRSGSVVACATRGVAGTEQAFVIAALQPGASADRGELASRVASHVREHLGLGLSDVLFVRPNQIPRTSSGKLQRTACAALVASGQISGMAETPALVYR